MNPTQQSSRTSRLKKRFLDVLSGSVKLDSRGATLFLEGLCAQDDPVGCLGAIIESPHGLVSVQSAMQFDLSVQFMNGLGSTVLHHLLGASDVGGDALDNLLFHIADPPIFWGVFVRTFQQGALSEDAQLVFAKMLSRLLTLQDRDTSPYRDVAAQPATQERLGASSKHEIREMEHLIKHILSSSSPVTAYDARHGPGGRHDNDFVDFRDIAILPTADEILCQQFPFLRTAPQDELDALETSVEDYLDNTFRMLREDMIFEIRQEVQVALQKGAKYRGLRVDGITLVGLHTGPKDRKTCWGVKLQCDSDFWQLKKVKDGNSEARVKYLTRDPHGSKILRHQSLVCLASGQNVISFGTVNRVEELLASKPPVIVVQLDGDINIKKTLTSLRTVQKLQLIQINSAVFSFEPVLSALKTCSVPLSKEILHWNPGSPLDPLTNKSSLSHIANVLMLNPSTELNSLLNLPKCIRLDDAQARSLVSGLQQRVSLIQGPPGTGKSFIGAILAKAIHDKTAQTVLVVCYTNHALDQFLCDLLEYDIPPQSIVRLGGRPNQSTDHLALQKQPRGQFRYDWSSIDELKRTALQHEAKLRSHFDALLDTEDRNLVQYLELNHPEFHGAFCVPLETEDGMTRVGPNGQDIDDKYLLSRWIQGLDAGVLRYEPQVRANAPIWGMTRSARQELLDKWRHELLADTLQPICHDGGAYNGLQDNIKREFAVSTVSILRQKRIIACTTTGAAIHAKTLEQAGPEVLLVEEAGEILEAHLLTALSHKVDQMILIGDHKQLRPKVNNYQLTVEKGEGFELNRSLFERLVLKGYPHETLATQHRMRPEISAFVRELTYPELTDAPSTYGRPSIRGVQSNIIFVNHTHPEDDNTLIGDRADGGTKASKQNTYEVQMVLKMVRYLVQQGYKSEDVVVLTPYLGQLHKLRDALKCDNDPVLNDLDASELARADLSSAAPSEAKAKKNRIHLATIDNYQGEESNIVIASLTRSNKSNLIGFMNSPERLNVLLSRARDGLILIGNAQTFIKSKQGGPLWKRFFTLLQNGQYVYQGFPVKCERHPECAILLTRESDFAVHCPDGGCTAPCGFMLACGHACSMKCHPQRSSVLNDPHDESRCKQERNARCPAGHHTMTWECHRGQPADCAACVKEAKRLEGIARKALEAQKKREEAEAEHHRRMAELEAKLEEERLAAEEERRRQEEREAQRRREAEETELRRRIAEINAKRQAERAAAEERRKLEEEREQKRREAEEAKVRRRMAEMNARRQAEQAAAEEQRKLQEEREARMREQQRREEATKREEEMKRQRQDALAQMERNRAEALEAEKRQREQERAAAEIRERRIAEQRRTEALKAEKQRQKEEQVAAERKQRLVAEQHWAEAREAERQWEQAAAERRERLIAEQREAAAREAERQLRQQQEQAAAERRERLIAERPQEDARTTPSAEYVEQRRTATNELKAAAGGQWMAASKPETTEPSRCSIQ